MNAVRLGEFCHLLYPAQQVFVLGEWDGRIGLGDGRHGIGLLSNDRRRWFNAVCGSQSDRS